MSRTAPAQPRSSSKKMRKGIVAGIAGIALLAGGGASFATWTGTYGAEASDQHWHPSTFRRLRTPAEVVVTATRR